MVRSKKIMVIWVMSGKNKEANFGIIMEALVRAPLGLP